MKQTLLHVVLEKGNDKDIKMVMEIYFTKCKKYLAAIINSKDSKGYAPIHIAAIKERNYIIFKELLKHGAFYNLETAALSNERNQIRSKAISQISSSPPNTKSRHDSNDESSKASMKSPQIYKPCSKTEWKPGFGPQKTEESRPKTIEESGTKTEWKPGFGPQSKEELSSKTEWKPGFGPQAKAVTRIDPQIESKIRSELLETTVLRNPDYENPRYETVTTLTKDKKIKALYELLENSNNQPLEIQKLKELDAMDCINCQDKFGKTMLHYAVEKENPDLIKILLENDAKTETFEEDTEFLKKDEEYQPIIIALMKSNSAIALLLLKYGAAINITKFSRFGYLGCMKLKFEKLLNFIKKNESYNIDSIQSTIQEICAELKFDKFLMANIHDKDGNTYLHHAAQTNNMDIVKLLLIEGVPFNVKNKYGNTAENLASNQEIKDLLSFIRDLFFAASCEKIRFLESQADEVAKKINALEIITKARQRDYESYRYNVVNLLHVAAKHGKLDMIEWLIKIGADVKATDFLENTAIMIARESKHEDVVKYLEKLNTQ